MRTARLKIAILSIATVALVGLILFFKSAPQTNGPINIRNLMTALEQFSRDHQNRGVPLPVAVTLEDLIHSGLLQSQDAKPFGGASVVFYTDADETTPQKILVEVKLPDGTWNVVMGDGSVQQFSSKRYEQFRQSLARQDGQTNMSQSMLQPAP